MTIPAWILLALGLAAAEAVYAVLMAPLDERLPRELKDAVMLPRFRGQSSLGRTGLC
jgi:hypothetical protein